MESQVMRWVVVIRLLNGTEVARYRYASDSADEMAIAFRLVVHAIVDDAAWLGVGETTITVEPFTG